MQRILAIGVAIVAGSTADAAVIYVDRSLSTGANDGTSWSDAYRGAAGLKTAMDVAVAGDQVWATKTNCLFFGKSASHHGGAIHIELAAEVDLINVTVAGNSATNNYGGVV